MNNMNSKGVYVIIFLAGALLVNGILDLDSENKELKQRVVKLESEHIDAEQRLHLYREALAQTEITDLKAAEVFETTEAYRHLVSEMDEHKEFANDTTIEEE